VADWMPILRGGVTDFLPVTEVSFRLHLKFSNPTAPPSLRVEFLCGLSPYTEYVPLERQGYAREAAERWWFAMGGRAPAPSTVVQALRRTDELDAVIAITVARNGRFWNVVEKRVKRPDGSKVDVNHWGRCVVARDRQLRELVPMNDEVLF
jgi:DNA repair protein RadD